MSEFASFLNESELPFRFCPGCTHERVLKTLISTLDKLKLPKRNVVIVTDIGCVGISDKYINCSTFHGLHGRSIAYGMGLKIARPELTIIVLIGDGGVGIGVGHLISAARRNVGITVLVFNNFNFGMTGGQHSVTTFSGGKTSTTPNGNIEYPLDICSLSKSAGATFVARTSGMDKNLGDVMQEAIGHSGFSIVDIWEVCTAHYMPSNNFKKTELEAELKRAGGGVFVKSEKPEYSNVLHKEIVGNDDPCSVLQKYAVPCAESKGKIPKSVSVSIAGSAGMKIRYAASLLARAAIMSGNHATQKDDFPITVLTGFSISDVIISPEPINNLEPSPVDILLVLSESGYARFRSQDRIARKVYSVCGGVDACAVEIPLKAAVKKEHIAIFGISQVLQREGIIDPAQFRNSIEHFGYRGRSGEELAPQLVAAT